MLKKSPVTEDDANDAGSMLDELIETLNWCLAYTPDEDAAYQAERITEARLHLNTLDRFFKERARAFAQKIAAYERAASKE